MYLLFDVGGTNTRLASSDGKNILSETKFKTPQKFTEAVSLFFSTAAELTEGRKIKAIAGGTPGPLNRAKTELSTAPNLPDWNNKPLVRLLEKKFQCPVYLENDANLACLGEAVYGAGKNYSIVAYLTISTGMGGGRVVSKEINASAWGFEPGHQIVCDKHLDDLISGRGFRTRYKKPPEEIKDKKIWEEAAKYLSYGVYNTILYWSPDIVVLGGPMVLGKPSIPINEVRKNVKKLNNIFTELPPIVEAKLGDKAGLYGAIALVKNV